MCFESLLPLRFESLLYSTSFYKRPILVHFLLTHRNLKRIFSFKKEGKNKKWHLPIYILTSNVGGLSLPQETMENSIEVP